MSSVFIGYPVNWDRYVPVKEHSYRGVNFTLAFRDNDESDWVVVSEYTLTRRTEYRSFDTQKSAEDCLRAFRWENADRAEKNRMRDEVRQGREERAKAKANLQRMERYETVYVNDPLFGAY